MSSNTDFFPVKKVFKKKYPLSIKVIANNVPEKFSYISLALINDPLASYIGSWKTISLLANEKISK